jgi:uncharacterized SAM-binding protein YcdF (DUF218 family)
MMREASRQRTWETRKRGDDATPSANPGLVLRPSNTCAVAPGGGVATVPRAGSTRQQPDTTNDTRNAHETDAGRVGMGRAVRDADVPRRGRLQRARGCLVWAAVVLATLAVIGVVAVQLRAPILGWVGGLLYHADPLTPADAIVVLGGGPGDRDFEAADLFAEGYGPTIVLTRPPEQPMRAAFRARGLSAPPEIEIRLDQLTALGVPRVDVTVLQRTVESTRDEAALVAEWAEARDIARLIVVTSAFHTSRTRFIFGQAFRHLDTEVLIRPSRLSTFAPSTWWQNRTELRDGLFELQKYAYYRLTYLLGRDP